MKLYKQWTSLPVPTKKNKPSSETEKQSIELVKVFTKPIFEQVSSTKPISDLSTAIQTQPEGEEAANTCGLSKTWKKREKTLFWWDITGVAKLLDSPSHFSKLQIFRELQLIHI